MVQQTEIAPSWIDPDDEGISDDETAKILKKKPATLATWRSQGKGPRFRKVGRHVEYTPRFIREYQESCVRAPEPAAARRQRRATKTALERTARKNAASVPG
jgi:hypothetical protein